LPDSNAFSVFCKGTFPFSGKTISKKILLPKTAKGLKKPANQQNGM
jgi:hypothetical protein